MSTNQPQVTADDGGVRVPATAVSHDEIQRQLQRILQSRFFARSERLSRFLKFCVEQALAGNGAQLKEQVVGAGVFDRKLDYDPRLDPIVRVEARRLRAKLKAFYASAGGHEYVTIDFPKGTYAPVFLPREPDFREQINRPGETSIAILPFMNLDPGGDDYFSDGLTEELIHLLTQIRGLSIVSWHSVSRLRGREQDLDFIRHQLKVGVILRGSIRRSPERVRVTVQLIDTASGSYLWSEAYDRRMQDVFSIQEEIARAIVDTLQLALASPRRSVTQQPGPNLECYKLCLQGRFHANRRTEEGLEKSVLCFQQAIAADPSSALAHAALADTYSLLADYGTAPIAEMIPKARASALRALELDSCSAEALVALAFIRSMFEWNWKEAEILYRRAIAANPSYARARHWFGLDFLTVLGRFDEAVLELRFARRLDPLSQITLEGLGQVYMMRRDYSAAEAVYREGIELDPTFYKTFGSLGRILSLLGRYDESIAMFEKARSLGGNLPSLIGALGQTLSLAGRRNEALACLDLLREIGATRSIPCVTLGILHLGLGNTPEALDWLERGCERKEIGVAWLKVNPIYDSIRDAPRFQAMLRRIGLLP